MTHRPTIRPATSGEPGACPGKPALAHPLRDPHQADRGGAPPAGAARRPRAGRGGGRAAGDLANPTGHPEPPLPPDPPEPPGKGPGDLVNPTADPDPPTPPKDPHPSGDVSFPTPERVDAGFGGAAAGTSQAAAGLALIAPALLLALAVVVVARRHRAESGPAR